MPRELKTIAITLIDPNPANARKWFDDAAQAEFGISLKQGQRVECIVYRQGDRYILVDGERRLRAAKQAGLTELTCVVLEKAPTKGELYLTQLAIDAYKAHLRPMERAALYAAVMQENNLSAEQLHKREGISTATISKYGSLFKCIKEVQAAVDAGTIGVTDAAVLSKGSPEQQLDWLRVRLAGSTRDELASHVRRQRSGLAPTVRVKRIKCPLSSGATVTISGRGVSLDDGIEAASLAIKAMKKAKAEGLDSRTAQAVWRDKSKANGV